MQLLLKPVNLSQPSQPVAVGPVRRTLILWSYQPRLVVKVPPINVPVKIHHRSQGSVFVELWVWRVVEDVVVPGWGLCARWSVRE